MSRVLRPSGAALAAVLLAAVPLAAACDAGQNASTKRERFSAGAVYSLGELKVQDVELHPMPGQSSVTGSALLTFAVFNMSQNEVTLTGITTEFGGSVQAAGADLGSGASASAVPSASASASASAPPSTSPSGAPSGSSGSPSPPPSSPPPTAALPLEIPAGGGLDIGPGGAAQLVVSGLGQTVEVGRLVSMRFRFDPGGATPDIAVPVTGSQNPAVTGTPGTVTLETYEPPEINPSYYEPNYDDRSGEPGSPTAGH